VIIRPSAAGCLRVLYNEEPIIDEGIHEVVTDSKLDISWQGQHIGSGAAPPGGFVVVFDALMWHENRARECVMDRWQQRLGGVALHRMHAYCTKITCVGVI
jgi:hypothetical protein